MGSALSFIVPPLVLLASLPPLYLSITSSNLLMKYENVTKKASKFSNEAGHQLRKTRTTQGSAVLACLSSTVCATWLSFSKSTTSTVVVLALLNGASCIGAMLYVTDFWKGARKTPLPGSRQYNDAIRTTERFLPWLGYLAAAWTGYGIITALVGH